MAGNIRIERTGARIVELLMPFEYKGAKIDAVTLGPFVLDHTMRWRKAGYKDWFELMVDVASINGKPASRDEVGQLRYPDADRVAESFVEILPQEIREAQTSGMWPVLEPRAPTNGAAQATKFPEEVDMANEKSGANTIDPLNLDD